MDRPYVILNAAMTVDGKISSVEEDSEISCEKDLDRVHLIRSEVDGIMVGIGTVLSDDPRLTVRRADGENPTRIIVDSLLRTPSDVRVLDNSARTIIATSEKAEDKDRERIRSQNVEVIATGDKKVDLKSLLRILKREGIERLLLEGGSTLNWGMLDQGLVDEVRIAIHPCIVGGESAKTLVGGRGMKKIEEGVKLRLSEVERVGEDLLLVYKTEGSSSD